MSLNKGGFYDVVLVGNHCRSSHWYYLVAYCSKKIAPDFPQKISFCADFLFGVILSLFSDL